MSEPGTLSWVVGEDMSPLGQRARTLLFTAIAVATGSEFLLLPLSQIPTMQHSEGQVALTLIVDCITNCTK